jgi:hypothetical protein
MKNRYHYRDAMIRHGLRLKPGACSALVLLTLGTACTEKDPLYCDEHTTCGPGLRCAQDARTCEPAVDSIYAPVDAGEDGADLTPTADAGSDLELDAPAIDSIALDSVALDGSVDSAMPTGSLCQTGSDCATGFCIDDVCCETACTETCRTCARSASELGKCMLVAAGADPRADCVGSDSACKGDCDGQGQCNFPGKELSCAVESCLAGEATAFGCDGQGVCVKETTQCGGFVCDGKVCKTNCLTAADCTGTFGCVLGQCIAELADGAGCGTNAQACKSKQCVDGVCCASASCAVCNACNTLGSEGICAPTINGSTCASTSCNGGTKSVFGCIQGSCQATNTNCGLFQCDATATDCRQSCQFDSHCADDAYCSSTNCLAKKSNGSPCSATNQCTSGFCVAATVGGPSYCCDKACAGGPCESCAISGKIGTCSFLTAGQGCPNPSADPNLADKCDRISGEEYLIQRQCQGDSAQCADSPKLCDPYFCDATTTLCQTSCTVDNECNSGFCDPLNTMQAKDTCVAKASLCHVNTAAVAGGDGSEGAPYQLIQSCLNLPSFHYVLITAGAYAESLSVGHDVELIGRGTAEVTAPAGSAVDVSGPNRVGLQNLTLIANHGSGVYGPANSTIEGKSLDVQYCPTAFQTLGELNLDTVEISSVVTGISGSLATIALTDVNIVTASSTGIALVSGTFAGNRISISESATAFTASGATVNIDRLGVFDNQDGLLLVQGSGGFISNLLTYDNTGETIRISDCSSSTVDIGYSTIFGDRDQTADLFCCEGEVSLNSKPVISNSIVWDEKNADTSVGHCVFAYSDVRTLSGAVVGGTGNLQADPLFLDMSGGDFRLQGTSTCINKGSAGYGGTAVPRSDYWGGERVESGTIDIGADEVSP